ncbi:MAG: chain length determinant protein EpsF [Pseudomonadota bacterium]
MTLVQFFSILRARWKIMLLVLGAAVLGTALVNALLPRSYTSTVAVLVDVKSPDPIAGIIFPGMNSPSYMATQVDVIQSDRVSQQVVRTLHLNDSASMREQWRDATKGAGNFETWLADLLRKSLDVKPSRDSNVISVNYKSPDPKFATAMANAYAQAYIDVSLELRVEPAKQYGRFFEERSKQLREKVEQARAKLTAFQRQKGIVGVDERLDVENARLNELSSQMIALQAVGAETASRQAQARTSADQLPDTLGNALISNLRIELSRQESRLKELGERLGDSHPAITELKANVNELRARIDKETGRVSGGVSVSNSINVARLTQVRAALEAQRVKVLRLKESRDALAVLAADVDASQRAYDGVSVRANQTELESRTTQTNLYVLNPASEPTQPASPRVTLNMLLALFVGTLLAVGVAMLMELFDRRVRSALDVVQALETPLLGVLARKPTGRLFGRKQLAAQSPSVEVRVEEAVGQQTVEAAYPITTARIDGRADTPAAGAGSAAASDSGESVVRDLALGEIFKETRRLDADQIEAILAYQRTHGVLFGEAAVALKLVDGADVLWALSRQFHYPYALEGRKQFNPELITATTPFSSVSETFRSIRSQLIRRFEQDSERRALAVVSADAGDGKTFLAANLAIAFSQLGRRTLLIDADMRAPRLHKVFGIDNSRGLSSILSGRLSARVLAPVTDLPSLFVLPVGVAPPNPLELLESPAFGLLIRELLGKFDHVIVDSPSAVSGADAGVVAARCGAFVSVARQGKTRMDSMFELVNSLRDSATLSLGFVLNEH